MRNLLLILCIFYFATTSGQIIDVHLHSYDSTGYWGGRAHPTGISSPQSADEHLSETIELMDKHNIEYAVVSGNTFEGVEKYANADPRFIPAYGDGLDNLIPIDQFEKLIKDGKIKVFGEIGSTYFGKTLNDPIFEPYLSLCEELKIPVAYHSGGFPPMATYRCCPKARLSLSDPFLIEDVLVKYPNLKIYLMHSGEVFYEHTLRIMKMYP
ncbi:MAG: amidohydrolase family protein, partial [Melioribacteraceae bacterium]|nr:amidohydrolase family protein [Melioribacteraceae bacterium]